MSFLANSSGMDREFQKDSRMEKINALKILGCFKVAATEKVKQHRVYRARFVDYVKCNGS